MKANPVMQSRSAQLRLRTSQNSVLKNVAWIIEQRPQLDGSDAPGSHQKDRRSAQPILQNADRALLNASIDPLQSNRAFVFTAPAEVFGPKRWALQERSKGSGGHKDEGPTVSCWPFEFPSWLFWSTSNLGKVNNYE